MNEKGGEQSPLFLFMAIGATIAAIFSSGVSAVASASGRNPHNPLDFGFYIAAVGTQARATIVKLNPASVSP